MAREADLNRMRVIHVISNLGIGGAETMLVRLVREHAGTTVSHSVVSFLPGGVYAPVLRELGVEVTELEGTRSLRSAALLRPLGAALARAKPDLVQGWMYHGNIAASLAAMLGYYRAPVLWGIRQTLERLGDNRALTRGVILAGSALGFHPRRIVYNSTGPRSSTKPSGTRNRSGSRSTTASTPSASGPISPRASAPGRGSGWHRCRSHRPRGAQRPDERQRHAVQGVSPAGDAAAQCAPRRRRHGHGHVGSRAGAAGAPHRSAQARAFPRAPAQAGCYWFRPSMSPCPARACRRAFRMCSRGHGLRRARRLHPPRRGRDHHRRPGPPGAATRP